MIKPVMFQAKLVRKSRKAWKCEQCQRDIPIGFSYVVFPGIPVGETVVKNIPLCVECAYLLSKMPVKNRSVRTGGFTERLIPNCLRKLRQGFRADPTGTLRKWCREYEEKKRLNAVETVEKD